MHIVTNGLKVHHPDCDNMTISCFNITLELKTIADLLKIVFIANKVEKFSAIKISQCFCKTFVLWKFCIHYII